MTLFNGRNVSLTLCLCIGFILIGIINIDGGVGAEKEIPATKFGDNAPTMTFFYW